MKNYEQLRQGQALKEAIEKVEKDIRMWEISFEFNAIQLRGRDKELSYDSCEYIEKVYVPFDIVKVLTLDALNKQLVKLKKQFAEL